MDDYPLDMPLVRFNKNSNVPTAVRETSKYPKWRVHFNTYTPVQHNIYGLNFTKTPHWSDNNHLCRKSYYEHLWSIFEKYGAFSGKLRAPERVMTMDYIHQFFPNCTQWCTHLYGGYGEPATITHLEGRLTMSLPA